MSICKTQKDYCKSIVRVVGSSLEGDGNANKYLVVFHDTWEPFENLNPSCYPLINELEDGLLERCKNDELDRVDNLIDNVESDSANGSNSWVVKGISNYSKSKNVSMRTILFLLSQCAIYLIIVSEFDRVMFFLLRGRTNGCRAL